MSEVLRRSKQYFNNLLDDVLRWLASHKSYGIQVSEEEYKEWYAKLTLASFILRDFLEEKQ